MNEMKIEILGESEREIEVGYLIVVFEGVLEKNKDFTFEEFFEVVNNDWFVFQSQNLTINEKQFIKSHFELMSDKEVK